MIATSQLFIVTDALGLFSIYLQQKSRKRKLLASLSLNFEKLKKVPEFCQSFSLQISHRVCSFGQINFSINSITVHISWI